MGKQKLDGIGQMDGAQIPRSVTQPEFSQVAEAGRDFKTNAFQRQRAVAATLGAPDFGDKGQEQFFGGGAGLGDIIVIQKTVQGCLANLGMNLAVVFQFDPSLACFIELVQLQIDDAFEHGQQPALHLTPKSLLLSILVRRKG